MQVTPLRFLGAIFALATFLLACRTADLVLGTTADVTPTAGVRSTRAAQRPTFTEIPPATDTPEPTATPEPSETPVPTDVPPPPTATRRPATARPRPTETPVPATRVPTPVPSPTQSFDWTLNGAQSCTAGTDAQSSASGKITANNKAAVGQKVQASSGPGGEPISDNPSESDKNGNYKVTFVCGGKACTGDFYIWMIDGATKHQISPFVKFHFDSGCHAGKQDFVKR